MGKALLMGGVAVLTLAFTGAANAADWYGSRPGYSSGYRAPGYGYSNGGSRAYAPGHYDYVPGHYDRHRGHYDYVPPHVDYHVGRRRYEVAPYYPRGPVGPAHRHHR